MSTTTGNFGLKKPQDADNADLKIFVGDNMDIIDAELLKRLTKDATTGKVKTTDLPILDTNGSWSNTSNSAFRATSNVSQTMGAGLVVKMIFGQEDFDIRSEYDITTGKFTANQAGVYLFSSTVRLDVTTNTELFLAFYKNGVVDTRVQQFTNGGAVAKVAQAHGSLIIHLNAGDYIEVYAFSTVATVTKGYESTGYYSTYLSGIKLA